MATVYVVTAGSGDSYRIERVYLDGDAGLQVRPGLQRHRAGGAGAGGGMAGRGPAGRLRRPVLAGGVVGARPGQPSGAGRCGTPTRANGSTTSPSARSGGPATRCPRPRWCAGNWPGCPRSRWSGDPRRRWRRSSGRRSPRRGPSWPECPGNSFRYLCGKWNEMGMATRHCRPGASSSTAWTDATWNGSATTS